MFWIPSGADNKDTSLMLESLTPDCLIKFIASIAEFPVANMGSRTIKSLFFILGSLHKYSTGLYVCSSRYNPIWPFSALGKNLMNPSMSPKPARSIGTITIVFDKSLPRVFVIGV